MATQHTTPIIIPALDAYSSQTGNTETIGSTVVQTGNAVRMPLGTKVSLNDGGEALYVQALSAIPAFNAVVISVGHVASNLTTTNAADGSGISKQVGWAQTSIAISAYGWVQTSGRPKGNLASACADRVILFTTGTAGVLDDATVSAALIAGVVSKTTISNATAITLMVPTNAFVHPHANPA